MGWVNLEKFKNLFKLRDQKWSEDGPLNKKLLNTHGNFLKVVHDTIKDFAFLKKKLEFRRIFDDLLAKYLSSKEFLGGSDYIYCYLPNLE